MSENIVRIMSSPASDIAIDRDEALRYLGYTRGACDERTYALLDASEKELRGVLSCKACFTRTGIKVTQEESVVLCDLGALELPSHSLARNLCGCTSAFVFAATTGIGVDRLIAKYSTLSPAKSVIVDALASAAIEGWCNRVNTALVGTLHSRPRFSPGYGDLDIGYQKNIVALLGAVKKIGLSLSDSMMMIPTKSVTAIIGIFGEEN